MQDKTNILTDSFNRKHTYLRISLIENCNLRCTYCMPEEGLKLTPKSQIMTGDEVYEIAKTFVANGVSRIRLTGGEPLIRKDIKDIIKNLATLDVSLSITTNAIRLAEFLPFLKEYNVNRLNISLDTLKQDKFKHITRRDYYQKVMDNINLAIKEGFFVKLNIVLIKGFNDNEIIDFIELTKDSAIVIRFIEFMPFDGNKWNKEKLVSYDEIIKKVEANYQKEQVLRIKDAPNDTSKNYQIADYKGSFAVISSVTNPFCDSCNRIRLTANGQIKNCLFSATESDILTPLRKGEDIRPIIAKTLQNKFKVRGGMNTLEKLEDASLHTKNRNMTTIGG